MTDFTASAVRTFRESFPLFAEVNLKVRDKEANIVPFVLNTAQIYIHERIEQQRRQFGYVRALILKGRQQGACLSPETPVLMDDYSWKAIRDVKPGDRVVAFDEEPGVGKGRYMRTADVEAVVFCKEPCLRFTMASGRTLTLSTRHRMLSRQRGGTWTQWREARKFKVGDVIRRLTYPDSSPDHEDDGWDEIVSVEDVGVQDVVDLQTSTKTFIADGLASHNSTYVEGRYYWKTTLWRNKSAYILSHEQASANAIFGMVERYHKHCPIAPRTGVSNVRELEFPDLGSSYEVATAGAKAAGRGRNTHLFHGSEVAFWRSATEHFKASVQAVALLPGTEVILESTANGPQGEFFKRWNEAEAGIGDYIAIFVPWFWTPEYRRVLPDNWELSHDQDEDGDISEAEYKHLYGLDDEQMCWRRFKILELGSASAFKQEYPACVAAGTSVSTERGVLPVEDVAAGDVTPYGEVSHAWCSGEKDTVLVRTSDGAELRCTPEHRLLTEDGRWLRADECIGESLALAETVWPAQNASVEIGDFPAVRRQVELTEDLALWLGYFAGDGSFSDDTISFVCAGDDPDVADEVERLTEGLFGLKLRRRSVGKTNGGVELRAGSTRVRPVLAALGVVTDSGRSKRVVCVPDAIWRSPKPVVKAFLSGLFEADGFVSREGNYVKFFTKHAEFAGDVERLLAMFGVTCQRRCRVKKVDSGAEYTGWEIVLRVDATRLFNQQVGFRSARKSTRLARRRDTRHRNGVTAKGREVVSVEPAGRCKVYDLTVPGLERFPANWFVAHNCPQEAFQAAETDSLIRSADVMRARKTTLPATGPLVLGVDPSGGGGDGADRFCVAFRRGHKVERVLSRQKITEPEAEAWIKALIDEFDPAAVFIDNGGVGRYLTSYLHAAGPKYAKVVHAVNFGAKSQFKNAWPKKAGPKNRRAEMWERLQRAIASEEGFDLPDSDSIHGDLVSVQTKKDFNGDLLLMSKQDMKAKGLRSPDEGDAIALTYADAIYLPEWTEKAQMQSIDNIDGMVERSVYDDRPIDVGGPGGANAWMGF